jgi:hypothetical protein
MPIGHWPHIMHRGTQEDTEMKKSLLATVAAAALIASPGFALAQGSATEGSTPNAGASEMRKGGADMQKSGEDMRSGTNSMRNGARSKDDAGTTGQGSGMENSTDVQTRPEQTRPQRRSQGKAGHRSDMNSESRPNTVEQKADQRPNSRTRAQGEKQPDSKATQDRRGSGATTGQGAAASAPVQLTAEQKTTVRKTVIDSRSAPRIERNNINFNVSVGTAIPRTVRIVAVPEPLIRIHPAWRGYRYFVVGEEIIIVEPNTLRIVAVLDV